MKSVEIHVESSGPVVVAAVSGELNGEGVAAFTTALRDYAATAGSGLAVELSRVSLIDSSGLSALVNLVTRARVSDARVILVAPSPFVAGILSTTRLDTWFEICDSVAAAKRLLGG